MNKTINTMYFSATDTTKKVVLEVANEIFKNSSNEKDIKTIDFTLPSKRQSEVSFTKDNIVVIGVPVYAGRVPNKLVDYLNTIKGNGALAVCIVVYGNRDYDDALIELKDIMESDGFKVISGGAFIGEHSFSKILAKNRPDKKDLTIAKRFGDKIYKKITTENLLENVKVKGNKPYRKHYIPKDKKGHSSDIRKVIPKTNSNCINCKLCAKICPMGSIDYDDVSKLNGICIKCGACIKKCPTHAKYFDDEKYLMHKKELEEKYSNVRNEPELFI